jgi:hypothetical protein
METRCRYDWNFLAPWCAALKHHVDFGALEVKEGPWEEHNFRVQVSLPRRAFFDSDFDFKRAFHQVRDALKLIAAAAAVEKKTFRHLLKTFCAVDFGKMGEPKFEQEVQVAYLVTLDMGVGLSGDYDLVNLCGPEQWDFTGREYEAALAKIASINDVLAPGNPGVEVEIPVQIFFTLNEDMIYPQEAEDVTRQLDMLALCEAIIRDEWHQHSCVHGPTTVKPKMMRCTFVLAPMVADFSDAPVSTTMADVMESLGENNVGAARIQNLDIELHEDLATDPVTSRKALGRVLWALFVRNRGDLGAANQVPGQIQTLSVYCESTLRKMEFEAVCSALAVCRTTGNLQLRVKHGPGQGRGYQALVDLAGVRSLFQASEHVFIHRHVGDHRSSSNERG